MQPLAAYYKETIVKPAKHVGMRRSLAIVQAIVLHATAGSHASSLQELTDSPRRVSVHRYITKDGTIYHMVDDDVIAFHAGFSALGTYQENAPRDVNDVTLGIELQNLNNGSDPYPAAQVRACAAAIAYWERTLGRILPIVPHSLIDTRGKTDPRAFPWSELQFLLVELRS